MSELPRVTEILRAVGLGPDLSHVPTEILDGARKRGTAVHEAIEAITYGYFEEDALDVEHRPYVDAYRKFLKESGYEVIAAEVEVVNAEWGYRGHPDSVGWLLSHRTILDAKTGDDGGAEFQLAGYVEAWNAEHPTEPVTAAAVLHLRPNGTYRYDEIELPGARPVWYAAVTVYKAQPRQEVA